MESKADSASTEELELQSLQLDVKNLRRERDNDRKEFADFVKMVQANFASIQESLTTMQAQFSRFIVPMEGEATLVPATEAAQHKELPSGQSSTIPLTPPANPTGVMPKIPTKSDRPHTAPGGSSRRQDHLGRDLNLDGTLKYRHPNFNNQV